MPNSLSLKRTAHIFPELGKLTEATACNGWPRPRKRSRAASGDPRLSSEDWLDFESMLIDDFDFGTQPLSPSLRNAKKKECVSSDIAKILSSASSEMGPAYMEDDVLPICGSSSPPKPPPSSTSSSDLSLITLDDNDRSELLSTGTSHEKIANTTATDSETKGEPEAELLTLTSFPFRIFSADNNFFRLTGLPSSRVIGEPLLAVFTTSEKHDFYPHTVHSPLDVFTERSTLVTVSNDVSLPSERSMKIEPVLANFEGKKSAQVSHYKITLQ